MDITLEIQNIDAELCLDGAMLNTGAMIAEIDENDAFLKKLHITNFKEGFIPELSDVLLRARSNHNLEHFIISNCDICLNDARTIISFIEGANLLRLDILKCTKERHVLSAIINSAANPLMQTLNLHQLRIQEDAADAIINLLKTSPITKLCLSGCSFAGDGLVAILSAIKQSALEILILDQIRFRSKETMALIGCIQAAKLIKLSLKNASIMQNNRHELVAAIKQSSLAILNGENLQIFYMMETVNDLILHSNVTKFKFNTSSFRFEENMVLLNSMQKRMSHEHISLGCSYHTDQSFETLYEFLQSSRSRLTSIDMKYCFLSSEEFSRIIGLIKGSSIVSLSINGNNLKGKNVLAICDLLENHNLTELKLYECGVKILTAMMASIKKSSLVKLSTRYCAEIDNDTINEIKKELWIQQQKLSDNYRIKSARNAQCEKINK